MGNVEASRRYRASPQGKASASKWRKANRARISQRDKKKWASMSPDERLTHNLRRYGIDAAEYHVMLERQGGHCAICPSTNPRGPGDRFHVDHDHVTGKVRGLLCGPCNAALGLLMDDPLLVDSAARYLRASRNAWEARRALGGSG